MDTHTPEGHFEKFLEDNSEYAKIQDSGESSTINGFQDIDEMDDEIWIMQCPKGTDLMQLKGTKMKLPGRSNADDLEAIAVEYIDDAKQCFGYCNRKGKYSLRVLPVHGSIVLRKKLRTNEASTMEQIEKVDTAMGRVPKPEGIIVRHPLLGVHYQKQLTIDNAIAERLKNADETSARVLRETIHSRVNKTSGKKTPSKTKVAALNQTNGDGGIVEGSKKKKRKHSEGTSGVEIVESAEESSSRKKHKKSTKAKQKSCVEEEDVSEDLQWLKQL